MVGLLVDEIEIKDGFGGVNLISFHSNNKQEIQPIHSILISAAIQPIQFVFNFWFWFLAPKRKPNQEIQTEGWMAEMEWLRQTEQIKSKSIHSNHSNQINCWRQQFIFFSWIGIEIEWDLDLFQLMPPINQHWYQVQSNYFIKFHSFDLWTCPNAD